MGDASEDQERGNWLLYLCGEANLNKVALRRTSSNRAEQPVEWLVQMRLWRE